MPFAPAICNDDIRGTLRRRSPGRPGWLHSRPPAVGAFHVPFGELARLVTSTPFRGGLGGEQSQLDVLTSSSMFRHPRRDITWSLHVAVDRVGARGRLTDPQPEFVTLQSAVGSSGKPIHHILTRLNPATDDVNPHDLLRRVRGIADSCLSEGWTVLGSNPITLTEQLVRAAVARRLDTPAS